jgi:hypothetical protein
VVDEFRAKIHHRDTENTEVAQRNLRTGTFEAKHSSPKAIIKGNIAYRSNLVAMTTKFSLID